MFDEIKWNGKEKKINEEYSYIISQIFENDEKSLNQFFSFDSSRQNWSYLGNQCRNKYYDFVFSGCSETHGEYIAASYVEGGDISKIWGFQVAKELNLGKPLNLGMGSFSAHVIVKDLINHCIKNGNPKMILVLFPDFGRFPHVKNNKIKSSHLPNNHDYIQHFTLQQHFEKEFPPLSKAPHEAYEVLSYKQSVYVNLQSIIFLEQFCKSNDIYFKYASWDYLANLIFKKAKDLYPDLYSGYIESDFNNWHNWKKIHHPRLQECHLDLKDNYKTIFDYAWDGHHMGIHRHTHIAESFIEEYKKNVAKN